MLQHLYIQNYALIENLEIDFGRGFSVITGETGAGKSIMLGAIGLLLGQRADSKAIKPGSNRCVVEGCFDLSDVPVVKQFFEKNDLDYDEQNCILRRELSAAGKSRAFINDTPVSLAALKELGQSLVDIHSQHQSLLLQNSDYQLDILDNIAGQAENLAHYQAVYGRYQEVADRLSALKEEAEKARAEENYVKFQLQEIENGNFQLGEEEDLKKEFEFLTHAEEIKRALYTANNLLEGDEGEGALHLLKESAKALEEISSVFSMKDEADRIETCYIELKDVASSLSARLEETEYDPERQVQVTERLNLLYALEQKHHVPDLEGLLSLAREFRARLDGIADSDDKITALEQELSALGERLRENARILTKARQKEASTVEQKIVERLQPLGMPNVQFRVEITPLPAPGPKGADRVRFLFTANKKGELREVGEVASGGEIARVMLVLKSILAEASRMPTLIFDEIDTGVSGEVADRMARMMQIMGQTMQIICITHLPQMAASGKAHYFVYKVDGEEATQSHIRQLSPEERVYELARMSSGATVTEAALAHARELLKEYGTE